MISSKMANPICLFSQKAYYYLKHIEESYEVMKTHKSISISNMIFTFDKFEYVCHICFLKTCLFTSFDKNRV